MNFFEAQDQSRAKTFRLVLIFLFGILGIGTVVFTIVFLLCLYAIADFLSDLVIVEARSLGLTITVIFMIILILNLVFKILTLLRTGDRKTTEELVGELLTCGTIFLFQLLGLGPVIFTIVFLLYLYANADFSSYLAIVEATSIGLTIAVIFMIILIFISAFRTLTLLRTGGRKIAEELGGELLTCSTKIDGIPEIKISTLRNVNNEMALAAGLPVPSVYILNESSINAFAAGFNTMTSVIGVTKGAIYNLDRSELQAVIAHEYSHILNGDTRINSRFSGILYGMTFLRYVGAFLFRLAVRVGRKMGLAIALFGFIFFLGGLIGAFFAGWMRSLVSKEREFLADASAVQFTRNTSGIANALNKIRLRLGSDIKHEAYVKFSHMFFSGPYREGILNFDFGTHPPIEERIKRIDPNFIFEIGTKTEAYDMFFSGSYKEGISNFDSKPHLPFEERIKRAEPNSMSKTGAKTEAYEQSNIERSGDTDPKIILMSNMLLTSNVGTLNEKSIVEAQTIINLIPQNLKDLASSSVTVKELLLALVIVRTYERKDNEDILFATFTRTLQNQVNLEKLADILSQLRKLDPLLTLPLVNLATPAFNELSADTKQKSLLCLEKICRADGKITPFEIAVIQIMKTSTTPQNKLRKTKSDRDVLNSILNLFSFIIQTSKMSLHDSKQAMDQALDLIDQSKNFPLQFTPKDDLHEVSAEMALEALNTLSGLRFKEREVVLNSVLKLVAFDGQVSSEETEIQIAIFEALGCPYPQMLVID